MSHPTLNLVIPYTPYTQFDITSYVYVNMKTIFFTYTCINLYALI